MTNSNSGIGELCWTPNGQIVYASDAAGPYMDLWVMNADGGGNRQLTFTPDRYEHQPSLSPDGRQIVYETFQAGLKSIWRMGIDGDGAKELVHNVSSYAEPVVSPDSKWVYYNSRDENGNPAFWKVPFDGGQPVKVREQSSCRLSHDGKLFACGYHDPSPDVSTKLSHRVGRERRDCANARLAQRYDSGLLVARWTSG